VQRLKCRNILSDSNEFYIKVSNKKGDSRMEGNLGPSARYKVAKSALMINWGGKKRKGRDVTRRTFSGF
jgi:hypothetical protein